MTIVLPLAVTLLLATGVSCGGKSEQAGPAPEFSTVITPSGMPATSGTTKPTPSPTWPSPQDCVSYNPANVTRFYEAGIHVIRDGSHMLMRFHGGPEDPVGQQGLALAKRYRKHCFIGRDNTREERHSYIFDYWLEPSGMKPAIPDESCSDYDRNNLTVEDMGGGDGWRVKDHDNPLQLFDNGPDARNGKLVLSKYNRICYIGQGSDEIDQEIITYFP